MRQVEIDGGCHHQKYEVLDTLQAHAVPSLPKVCAASAHK